MKRDSVVEALQVLIEFIWLHGNSFFRGERVKHLVCQSIQDKNEAEGEIVKLMVHYLLLYHLGVEIFSVEICHGARTTTKKILVLVQLVGDKINISLVDIKDLLH